MQQSAPTQSHSRSQSTPGSGPSPPVLPSLGPGSQSRTLPPFRPGRELPLPLHHRAASGGISISSILGASSPPPLPQPTLQSTQQPASAPVSAAGSVVSAGSAAAGRSPSPQHQPQHQHVHRHHHHHLVSPNLPPEISHDADLQQLQQLPQQQQLQQPQRSRTSLSPETPFATGSPQQQQQQQPPPASTTPTPSEPEHRPRMSAASPFTVGPTLPPVQFDPSSTPRRTAPSTPQSQHTAPVEQPLHPAQPPSTLPHPQSSQSLQQVGQQSQAAPQESTPVRAEDAVARVVKKAAAAAASTISFSADQSIADSASGGSTNSSVIGSPTLDGDKSRKRRHHHRNHSHLFENGLGGLKRNSPSPPPVSTYDSMPTRYQLRVDSTDVLKAANGFPSYNLGSLVYTPTPDSHQPIIPRLEDKVNSLIQIRIARRFLSRRTNPHVTRREVWGTDVYTDDSDVVAAIYHSGYLAESSDSSNGEKGDCVATLRILPLLQKYQGTFRHGLNSRSWLTRHDGVSFRIEKVDFIRPGKAEDRGWKMKKRRLEEWRVSKEWREERYGGENLKNDFEMDVDK
ncbi:histone deacetylation protein Rxt3-domain-containing protein [Lipomyces starkeyi]